MLEKNNSVGTSPKNKWFDGIQALRGIMCILVLISHSGNFFAVDAKWGCMGVSAFFVISGFCNGYFYKTRSNMLLKEMLGGAWRYLKKIYPLYFVVLITSPFWQVFNGDWKDFVRSLFLLQSYFLDATKALVFNHPTWFVSSLLLAVFLSPLLNRIFKSKNIFLNIFLVLFFFVIEVIISYCFLEDSEAYGNGYYYVYIFPLTRLLDYICGILMARIIGQVENKALSVKFVPVNCVEIGIILYFVLSLYLYKRLPLIMHWTAVWTIGSLFLVFIFALKWGG